MFARRGQPACPSAKPNVPETVGASCRLDGEEKVRTTTRDAGGGRLKGSVVDVLVCIEGSGTWLLRVFGGLIR